MLKSICQFLYQHLMFSSLTNSLSCITSCPTHPAQPVQFVCIHKRCIDSDNHCVCIQSLNQHIQHSSMLVPIQLLRDSVPKYADELEKEGEMVREMLETYRKVLNQMKNTLLSVIQEAEQCLDTVLTVGSRDLTVKEYLGRIQAVKKHNIKFHMTGHQLENECKLILSTLSSQLSDLSKTLKDNIKVQSPPNDRTHRSSSTNISSETPTPNRKPTTSKNTPPASPARSPPSSDSSISCPSTSRASPSSSTMTCNSDKVMKFRVISVNYAGSNLWPYCSMRIYKDTFGKLMASIRRLPLVSKLTLIFWDQYFSEPGKADVIMHGLSLIKKLQQVEICNKAIGGLSNLQNSCLANNIYIRLTGK